ncbi:MAG: trypsin-like peptidase domain-containing protein [Uliginosibacterium sp.]|nr:trypsin-like peptidase domain-containing protein [Uliginosibacterium sp.]
MLRFSACLMSLLLPAVSMAAEPAAATAQSVCKPKFDSLEGLIEAGTAFVLQAPTKTPRPMLMTAHHLFGPAGGVERQLGWDELPSSIVAVECAPLAGQSGPILAVAPVGIKHARSYAEDGPLRDLAAFPIKDLNVPALKLAAADPKPGDTVWLVARVSGGASPQQLLHKAKVLKSDPGILEYSYDNSAIVLRATSGAPIVNDAGEVVGLNIGSRKGAHSVAGVAVPRKTLLSSLAGIK